MAHKHTRSRPHAEFRHRSQIPMPAVAEVEQRLLDVLSPSLLAPRQLERRDPRQPHRLIRMRQRLLTLPVMVAIMVSVVWRRVPSIAEVQKVLAREGLLGMAPLQVSSQAITKRLAVLPAAVMGQLLAEVCARLQAQVPPTVPHPRWAPVRERFALIALVDGSTLEALRKKTPVLREREGLVLGARWWSWWRPSATAHGGSCIRRTRQPMTSGLPPRSWQRCRWGDCWSSIGGFSAFCGLMT